LEDAGAPTAAWAGPVLLGDGDLVPLPGGRRGWSFAWWQLALAAVLVSAFAAARGYSLFKRQNSSI
jgi:hypothetical protein